MKDFGLLKTQIAAAIRENSSGAITGSVLQDQLLAIVGKMELSCFEGFATPSTTAVADTSGEHFYIAVTAGTYTNFGGTVLGSGDVYIFYRASGSSSWTAKQIAEGEVAVDDSTIGRNANGELMLKDGSVSLAKMTDAAKSNFATASQVTQLSLKVDELEESNENCVEAVEGFQQELDNITPTVVEGNVTNNADNEDIEAVNGALKLRNRTTAYANKGYVILRRNASFASQVTTANTIYEVRYNFNLGGAKVKMPSGCVLQFAGGTLDNGTLLGTDTAIVAGSYKIFGDNLNLYEFGFVSGGSGDVNEKVITLPYVVENGVVSTRRVTIPASVKISHSKMIHLDGYEATSNANGNGTIADIADTMDVYNDMVLSAVSAVTFSNHTATYNVSDLNGYQTASLFGDSSKNKFVVPSKSHYLFFNGDNKASVGDEVEYANVKAAYLNKAVAIVKDSTFRGTAKLSWFIGNEYATSDSQLTDVTDQSKNIQKALTMSVDLVSDIVGLIRIENSLYLDTQKHIDLGKMEFGSGKIVENSTWANRKLHFNWNGSTRFYTIGMNKPFLYFRNGDITLHGGEFTAAYATTHNKYMAIIDCDYMLSNVNINTYLVGKALSTGELSTQGGYWFATNDRNYGYASTMAISGMIKNTKFPLYKEKTENTSSWVTYIKITADVWGFYEALHIEGGSDFSFDMDCQSTVCIPSDEADNYRYAVLKGMSYSKADIFFWDVSVEKGSGTIVRPFRNALATGNIDLYGRSKGNNFYQWDYSFKNNFYEEKAVFQSTNRKFKHTLLDNVAQKAWDIATSYLKVCSADNFEESLLPSVGADGTVREGVTIIKDQGIYIARYVYNNTTVPQVTNIASGSYVEFCIFNPTINNRIYHVNLFGRNFTGETNLPTDIQLVYKKPNSTAVSNMYSADMLKSGYSTIVSTIGVTTSLEYLIIRAWGYPEGTGYFPCMAAMDMDGNTIWGIANGYTSYGSIVMSKGGFLNAISAPALHTKVAINLNTQGMSTLRSVTPYANSQDSLILTSINDGRVWVFHKRINKVYNLDGTLATTMEVGSIDQRPMSDSSNAISAGTRFYDTTLKTLLYCSSSNGAQGYANWVTTYGAQVNHGATANVTAIRGTSAVREAMTMYSDNNGLQFYDTTLKKYVLWNGTAWVNLDGTALA